MKEWEAHGTPWQGAACGGHQRPRERERPSRHGAHAWRGNRARERKGNLVGRDDALGTGRPWPRGQ